MCRASLSRSLSFPVIILLKADVAFVVAGVIGLIGTLVFAATVEERYAS